MNYKGYWRAEHFLRGHRDISLKIASQDDQENELEASISISGKPEFAATLLVAINGDTIELWPKNSVDPRNVEFKGKFSTDENGEDIIKGTLLFDGNSYPIAFTRKSVD